MYMCECACMCVRVHGGVCMPVWQASGPGSDQVLRWSPEAQARAARSAGQTKRLWFCQRVGVPGKAKGALGRAACTMALAGRGKFPGPVRVPDTAGREKENIKKPILSSQRESRRPALKP